MTVAHHPSKNRAIRQSPTQRIPQASKELTQNTNLFRLALILTDWGTAGILWRQDSPPADSPFSHAPTSGLLSRIVIPGHPPEQLRKILTPAGTHVTEVFLPSPDQCRAEWVPTWVGPLVELLQATFSNTVHIAEFVSRGENFSAWEPNLDFTQMTDFQRRVLGIVGRIPPGATRTYGQVAELAGNPKGARAVGMVMRSNPWPILVPCHRVVGAAGQLTGFSAPGGVGAKKRLLEREGSR